MKENVFLLTWTLCCESGLMENEKQRFCAALADTVCIRNELCKQMTPSWRIILNATQANIRGAAYIMHLSITMKMTILAKADTEKGKNCDITPNWICLHWPFMEKQLGSSGFALSSPSYMFGAWRRHWGKSGAAARSPVFPVRQSPCFVS